MSYQHWTSEEALFYYFFHLTGSTSVRENSGLSPLKLAGSFYIYTVE